MLNSYPIYNHHHSSNSLNPGLSSLAKYRRNSFSQPSTFEDFDDPYFSPPSPPRSKLTEAPPEETKDDSSLSFLDGLELSNNLSSSTPPPSNIQCVRIIRRSDTAPLPATTNANPRRVVRVIRLSNTARSTEASSPSNVYVVRKTDITPSVQINPAIKHMIGKATPTIDETIHTNKLYGATISIFGIEFTVVSNDTSTADTRASLVQNSDETKANVQSGNKVHLIRS